MGCRYSDGASFSGFRAEPWAVPNSTDTVTFRGIKNLDGVIDFAMAHGMNKATEFAVTGGSAGTCAIASLHSFRQSQFGQPRNCSTSKFLRNLQPAFASDMLCADVNTDVALCGRAGGLSTFLHADRIANRLKAEAPNIKRITAMPVVGYFLDHDNFAHTTGFPGGPNTPEWSTPGTGANYTMWMKCASKKKCPISPLPYHDPLERLRWAHWLILLLVLGSDVYGMQNMSFGEDGALMAACEAKHPTEPWLCFMSPHMVDVIQTPFFMLNSKCE